MSKSNLKFMRVLFIALAISGLLMGLFDIVDIRGQTIASIVLLLPLLVVDLINFKKPED